MSIKRTNKLYLSPMPPLGQNEEAKRTTAHREVPSLPLEEEGRALGLPSTTRQND
jgi:hypothetical protein